MDIQERQAGASKFDSDSRFNAALALSDAVGDGVNERTSFSEFEWLVSVVISALQGDLEKPLH